MILRIYEKMMPEVDGGIRNLGLGTFNKRPEILKPPEDGF
jgi:hypothetical protein